ncbi:hypothetical protein FOZ62_020175, partial [Perkinsus olseni]
ATTPVVNRQEMPQSSVAKSYRACGTEGNLPQRVAVLIREEALVNPSESSALRTPSLPPAHTFFDGDSAIQRASSSLLRPAASTRGSHPRSAVEGKEPVFASGKGAEEFSRLDDDDVSVVRSVTSSCAGYYPAG